MSCGTPAHQYWTPPDRPPRRLEADADSTDDVVCRTECPSASNFARLGVRGFQRRLEMTGGQRAELERLARSHTAPAREVRQAKALLWGATEGTAAVGRARAANQGSMMRPARASKPDGYLLGSYRIATAPEPNSSRLTSFKSTCFDNPANNVGPWPASLGCTTNSYSSINPNSVNVSGSLIPPTNSPLPDSRLNC